MPQPLLEGQVDETVRLRREIAGLEQELEQAKEELRSTKQASANAIRAVNVIRRQLEPWHHAMKLLFEEINRVGVDSEELVSGDSSGSLSPKWQMMKQKLGHREAQIIDALQHGGMTVKQMTAVLHWDIKTVYRFTKKMTDSNLLINEGGKFSLRNL